MKRIISVLLTLAMCLSMLAVGASAATPDGWSSDGGAIQGWDLEEGSGSFTLSRAAQESATRRVWKNLLADSKERFKVTMTVQVGEGGRAYLKVMNSNIELTAKDGNGNQLYVNGGWVNAQDRAARVELTRSGGEIAVKITGATGADVADEDVRSFSLRPEDTDADNLEFGVEEDTLGASVVYSDVTVEKNWTGGGSTPDPEEPSLTGKSPAEFGWETDESNFTGKVASDDGSTLRIAKGSGDARLWKTLLADSGSFQVTVDVSTQGVGPRGYVKVLGKTVEFNSENASSEQLYIKINDAGKDWVSAAGYEARVVLRRVDGGALSVTVTGKGSDGGAVTDTVTIPAGEDSQRKEVELGCYGGTVAFSNVAVVNFYHDDSAAPSDHGWASDDGGMAAWTANATGSRFTGAKGSGDTRIWKSLITNQNDFTLTAKLTVDEASSGYVKVLGKTVELDARGGEADQMCVKTGGGSDPWAQAKNRQAVVTVSRADAGELRYTVQGLSGDGVTGEKLTGALTGPYEAGDALELGVYAGRVIFEEITVINQEEGGGTSTELPLSANRAFWAKAKVTMETGAFSMDLMQGQEKAVTLRVTRSGDDLRGVLQTAAGAAIPLEGAVSAPADEEGTQVVLSRLQGRDDLLVSVGSCGYFTVGAVETLNSVDRVVLRTTAGVTFEEQSVAAPTQLVSPVEAGERSAFVAMPGRGSKWTWGTDGTKGNWALSDKTDKNTENAGDTVQLAFVQDRLGEAWTLNGVLEVKSSAKSDRRGVARLQLLDAYKNPKAIFTLETIGREMKLTWEATDRPEDGNWVKGEATDWRVNSDSAYNVSITRPKDSGELTISVLGDRGYRHDFQAQIAPQVLETLCYVGLAAEDTTAEFRNVFVTSEGGSAASFDSKAVYADLMKNFRSDDRLTPVIFGYPAGYRTNSEQGNVISVDREGSLWESSILMMALDTYYETLEAGAEKTEVSQTLANTVNAFLGSYTEAELTSVPNYVQNHAMDDCGWNVTALLLGHKHNTALGNTAQAAKCLDYAKKLFHNTYDAFYDAQLGGGLWYNSSKTDKTLYAATLALAGYDLYQLTQDAEVKTKYEAIYRGVEDNLRRADGLYWMALRADGAMGMANPYEIGEGGSCTYLGGNMAMAVLNHRLGETEKAKQTAEGMLLYETSGTGAYLNDRDAWNNTFFLGLWQRELLETGVLDARHADVLWATADGILEHAVFPEGYYSAAWEGPQEPSYKGYPWGYEGERNRWGSQVYENGYYIGSTPSQLMTSATTAHVLLAAAGQTAQTEQSGPALTALAMEGASLFPGFHGDVTAYTLAGKLSASAKEAVVTWTAPAGATVTVNGAAAESPLTVALTGSSTVVTLAVEKDGQSKTYTLTVEKGSSGGGGGGSGSVGGGASAGPALQPSDKAHVAAAAVGRGQLRQEGTQIKAQSINGGVSCRLDKVESTDGDETLTLLTGAERLSVTLSPAALTQAKDRLMLQTPKAAAVIPAETLRAVGAAYPAAEGVTLTLSGAVELTVEADGAAVAWKDPAHPFILALPDALGDGQRAAGLYLQAADGAASGARVHQGWAFFQVVAAGSYSALYGQENFADVSEKLWYADTLLFGKNTGLLRPGELTATQPVTRGQAAMLMARLLRLPDAPAEAGFADVDAAHPCAPYINSAKAARIVNGVGDGCYAPDRVVTRQELFAMLGNALKTFYGLELNDSPVCLERFADRGQIGTWAEPACAAMVNAGYIQGTSLNTLSPGTPATCAEFLQTFYNFYRNGLSGMPAAFFRDASAAWEKEGAFAVVTGKDGKATASIGANQDNFYAWDRGTALANNWAVEADLTLQATKNDHGTFRLAFQTGGKDLAALLTVDYDHINGGLQLQGQILRNNNWETVLTSGDYESCSDTAFHILAGRPKGTNAIYVEITGDKGFRYSELSAEIPKAFLDQFTYLGVGTYASAVTFRDVTYGTMNAMGASAAPSEENGGQGSVVAGDWTVGAGVKVRNGVMTLDKKGQTETWHSAKLAGDFHVAVEFQPVRSYRSDGLTTTRFGFVNANNDMTAILTVTGDPEGKYLLEAQYNDGSWFHLVANDWEEVPGERLTLDIQRQGTFLTLTLKSDQGYEKVSKTVELTQAEMDKLQQFGLLVIDSAVQVYRVEIR